MVYKIMYNQCIVLTNSNTDKMLTLTCATMNSVYAERFFIAGLTPTKVSPLAFAALAASN